MAELRWITTDTPGDKRSLFDTVVERQIGRGAYRGLEFLHVESRTIINRVPHPSALPFEYTINAYRGCSHACTYCFARPSHDYLGLGIGRDFDTKIVVKINAPEILRHETAPQRWAGHPIAMGTNTDPYQAAEGKYKLTRQIVEILAERGNSFSILTKSPLVLRDLDVLTRAAKAAEISVNFSIGTLDTDAWSRSEPGTAHPRKRIDAVRRLNEAGVSSGVLMMPILPGISDHPKACGGTGQGSRRGRGPVHHGWIPACAGTAQGPCTRVDRSGLPPPVTVLPAHLRNQVLRSPGHAPTSRGPDPALEDGPRRSRRGTPTAPAMRPPGKQPDPQLALFT